MKPYEVLSACFFACWAWLGVSVLEKSRGFLSPVLVSLLVAFSFVDFWKGVAGNFYKKATLLSGVCSASWLFFHGTGPAFVLGWFVSLVFVWRFIPLEPEK